MQPYLNGLKQYTTSCNGLQIMKKYEYVLLIAAGIAGLLAASWFPY